MSDDRIEELILEISNKLSGINANMETVLKQLAEHEHRITALERHPSNSVNYSNDSDFKTKMIELVGKCLIIALTSIASLVGGGSLLIKIIGQ